MTWGSSLKFRVESSDCMAADALLPPRTGVLYQPVRRFRHFVEAQSIGRMILQHSGTRTPAFSMPAGQRRGSGLCAEIQYTIQRDDDYPHLRCHKATPVQLEYLAADFLSTWTVSCWTLLTISLAAMTSLTRPIPVPA